MVISSIGFHSNPLVIHSNDGHIKRTTSKIKHQKTTILHGIGTQITNCCCCWLADNKYVIFRDTCLLDCVERCRSLIVVKLGRNSNTHVTEFPLSKRPYNIKQVLHNIRTNFFGSLSNPILQFIYWFPINFNERTTKSILEFFHLRGVEVPSHHSLRVSGYISSSLSHIRANNTSQYRVIPPIEYSRWKQVGTIRRSNGCRYFISYTANTGVCRSKIDSHLCRLRCFIRHVPKTDSLTDVT